LSARRTDVALALLPGLATTILVMHTFRAAQPALLYLSPACVVSVALRAALRGESAQLWGYVDGGEDDARADDERKKDK